MYRTGRWTQASLLAAAAAFGAGGAQAGGFEQRYLWTWDHRMDWAGKTPGRTEMGGGATYQKTAEEYVEDYSRLVDFMHDYTTFKAIIIWGFLRDSHGGVEAAKQVCDYAKARGIRVIPGVGTSGYEGYYFEGNHRYNVSTWLREHPELRAVREDGTPHNALCPSKPENVAWLNEGCRWMFDTFDIGGLNFEVGDFFVCHCDDCKRARAALPGDAPDHFKDMAISTAPVATLAHEIAPDAWLTYATYTGFTPEMAKAPPSWVNLVPASIACQWTLTGMVSDAAWPPGLRPPTPRNTGYLHWGNKSTHSVNGFYVEHIRDVCRRAHEAGFVGLATYGEDPASIFTMRLFYDAWSYFLEHPEETLEQYADDDLAEWFDSTRDAREFLGIARRLETAGVTRAALPGAIEQAEAARAATNVPKAVATWDEFIAFLRERLKEFESAERTLAEPGEVEEAMRHGFRISQEASTTLVLREPDVKTLELLVRVDYSMENGLLPVMRLTLNDVALGPAQAIDRPARIRTPYHEGYDALPAFDEGSRAWRVKYDTDFEVDPLGGRKYDTADYSPLFRFSVADLWRDGVNVLRIENLERRFRPSTHGVLVIGKVELK